MLATQPERHFLSGLIQGAILECVQLAPRVRPGASALISPSYPHRNAPPCNTAAQAHAHTISKAPAPPFYKFSPTVRFLDCHYEKGNVAVLHSYCRAVRNLTRNRQGTLVAPCGSSSRITSPKNLFRMHACHATQCLPHAWGACMGPFLQAPGDFEGPAPHRSM